MKKAVLVVMLFLLVQLAVGVNALNDSENVTETNVTETQSDNVSLPWLPQINTTELGEKFKNATETGVGPLDQAINFLSDASPFLLLIIGILLIVLAGFGKIIGIVLIVLAIIRLIWLMFF